MCKLFYKKSLAHCFILSKLYMSQDKKKHKKIHVFFLLLCSHSTFMSWSKLFRSSFVKLFETRSFAEISTTYGFTSSIHNPWSSWWTSLSWSRGDLLRKRKSFECSFSDPLKMRLLTIHIGLTFRVGKKFQIQFLLNASYYHNLQWQSRKFRKRKKI